MREEKRKRLVYQLITYEMLFILGQIICYMGAYYNHVEYEYAALILVQIIVGIAAIGFVTWREGNGRLVLCAAMLLSIGQLIQSIIQTKEAFGKYQRNYFLFMVIAVTAVIVCWYVYGRFYYLLENKWINIGLSVCCILIPVFLKIFGRSTNDATLWVTVGNYQIQLSELIKPLFVICMSGFLCTKKKLKDSVLAAGFLFCILITGMLIGLLNEFGTALIIFLVGLIMIFVFQNARISTWLIGICLCGIFLLTVFLVIGNNMYHSIPMNVTDEIFTGNFAAVGNKEKLADMLEEELRSADQKTILDKEEKFDFSYSKFINFLRYEITDDEVNKSYDEEGKEFNDRQEQYREGIKVLASDAAFREKFQALFMSNTMYTNRTLHAYEQSFKTSGRTSGLFYKLKYVFLKYYMNIVGKVQEKVRGFLKPEEEEMRAAFHVNQSLSAMVSGGLFGNGPNITKSEGIFAADSDMVFSMVVAELGGFAGIVVVLLNMIIFKEAVMIALDTQSMYQKGIAIGLGLCWFLQTLIVIGGNCRFLPFTGITLPLISTGGTSLVISILMISLLALISVKPLYVCPGGGRRKLLKSRYLRRVYQDRQRKSKRDIQELEEINSVFEIESEEETESEQVEQINSCTKNFYARTKVPNSGKRQQTEENHHAEDEMEDFFDDL